MVLDGITAEWHRLKDVITPMHQEPDFLPNDFLITKVGGGAAATALMCTLTYCLSFIFVDKLVPDRKDLKRRSKVCYQMTNMLFNLCIGCVGVYLEYWVLPTLDCYDQDSVAKILGNHHELYLVSAMQLGYQFWAIPIGIIYVEEEKAMIIHHFAVVVSTSLTGFLTIGFRFYSSFFYGVMELSSIPLSIMNLFKENEEWNKKFPLALPVSRTIFSVMFLVIRIFLCLWKWPVFLRDNFVVFWTRPMGLFKLYFLLQWCLASFLAILQLYWATLIIRGTVKIARGLHQQWSTKQKKS